ncbi:MAG: hypothetical protein FWD45_04185, partial [Coriobacteriia bacterium]|nr:hypothetical protein [Coriobacteriia bacterium]
VGKTNLALNLIDRWLRLHKKLTLIDLDVVNPYFRSSDSAVWLEASGVKLLGPSLARSTLDTPSLAPGIDESIRSGSLDNPVLVDVGGDPDGARALSRYAESIRTQSYELIYIANFNRPEVANAASALALMQAIEAQSGLAVTGIISNTHLKEFTSVEQIMSTMPALLELSELAELPVLVITAPEELASDLKQALDTWLPGQRNSIPVLAMQQMVKTPWE